MLLGSHEAFCEQTSLVGNAELPLIQNLADSDTYTESRSSERSTRGLVMSIKGNIYLKSVRTAANWTCNANEQVPIDLAVQTISQSKAKGVLNKSLALSGPIKPNSIRLKGKFSTQGDAPQAQVGFKIGSPGGNKLPLSMTLTLSTTSGQKACQFVYQSVFVKQ
jgi:hypothetical protein